jgi:hypothetical protein
MTHKIISIIFFFSAQLTWAASNFETYAFEGCVLERKHPKSVCECNARNLDRILTNEEKKTYKRAAFGDPSAAVELLSFTDKLVDAFYKCADEL